MSTRRPGLGVILRDTLSFIGGWMIIFKQAGIFFAPPVQVSEIVVAVGALIIGVPGFAQIWAARTSTPALPPPPASPESAPSSSGAP